MVSGQLPPGQPSPKKGGQLGSRFLGVSLNGGTPHTPQNDHV